VHVTELSSHYNNINTETVQCMSLNCPHKSVQLFTSSQNNQFHTKITFIMAISNAQVKTFNQYAIYLPSTVFLMASCMWHFPDSVRLTAVLLQLLNSIDSLQRMTSQTVYREVLQSFNCKNKYILINI